MIEYPKIQSIWKRDPDNSYKTFLFEEWTLPEFEYLAMNDWTWTEKVDGTNVRVMWDGNEVRFGGRTERAQMHGTLVARLQDLFPAEKFRELEIGPMTLYGEGFGAGIQKGGHYGPIDFVLFDVLAGHWWLQRHDVIDIAHRMGIQTVPVVGVGNLYEMMDAVRLGITSRWSKDEPFVSEGVIARPKGVELYTRRGDRLITKVKTKDFPE